MLGRRDPVPDVLGLAERVEGRRVLVTGGAGSIGRSLTALLAALGPDLVTVVDAHEAALTADRHAKGALRLARFEHVLCDVRDRDRLEEETARARPDVVFHLAAYKHVDWAERYPVEFAATNLDGSWNVLRAAEQAGAASVVVASTDKAALAKNLYGRTKRLMETLTWLAAERTRLRPRGGAARQRARQRGQRDRAVAAPGARRRPADADRPDDGPLLDHDGPRRVARRARRAGGGRGRAARHRRRPGRVRDRPDRRAHLARRPASATRRSTSPACGRARRCARCSPGPARSSARSSSRAPPRSAADASTDDAAALVEEVERAAGAEERRRVWLAAMAPARAPAASA